MGDKILTVTMIIPENLADKAEKVGDALMRQWWDAGMKPEDFTYTITDEKTEKKEEGHA